MTFVCARKSEKDSTSKDKGGAGEETEVKDKTLSKHSKKGGVERKSGQFGVGKVRDSARTWNSRPNETDFTSAPGNIKATAKSGRAVRPRTQKRN